jgi:COP9 signalosome complex subunit 5
MAAASSDTALKTFALENNFKDISPQDDIFRYDAGEDRRINNEQPWKNECVNALIILTMGSSC